MPATRTCPACTATDAAQAAGAWRTTAAWIDESHLGVTICTCTTCGSAALHIWTELIDWEDGDDSQATIIVPLPTDWCPERLVEEDQIAALLRQRGPCACLVHCSPRGSHGAATWYWRMDQPIILPHD